MRRRKISGWPALIVACLALGVSLSGTGWAAFTLPPNSVGTLQLKQSAVMSSKVRNGSLLAVDAKPGELLGGVLTVVPNGGPVAPGSFALQQINCPAGYEAIGGGIDVGNVRTVAVTSSQPIFEGFPPGLLAVTPGNHHRAIGWRGTVRNDDTVKHGFRRRGDLREEPLNPLRTRRRSTTGRRSTRRSATWPLRESSRNVDGASTDRVSGGRG